MADYTKDLKKILREAGCSFERQGKGDHELLQAHLACPLFLSCKDTPP
jgi:hypothetical protein